MPVADLRSITGLKSEDFNQMGMKNKKAKIKSKKTAL